MRYRSVVWIAVLFVSLGLAACGGGSSKGPAAGESAGAVQPAETAPAGAPSSSGFQKISDYLDAWNALYKQNEEVINAYEGMPVLELVAAPATFIGTVQYDLLNLDGKNGRFEGKMMLSGIKGHVEKSGSTINFGYDRVLDKDGFGPAAKAGDHEAEKGVAELDKRYYRDESTTERGGKLISRSTNEFKVLADGSMIALVFHGQVFNARGDEEPGDSVIYIHNGKGIYDFVVGKGKTGPGFAGFSFADKGDLTKDHVLAELQASGYDLDKSGGIKDGKLVLDK